MLRAIKRMREVSKAHGKREVLIRALRKMELKLHEKLLHFSHSYSCFRSVVVGLQQRDFRPAKPPES